MADLGSIAARLTLDISNFTSNMQNASNQLRSQANGTNTTLQQAGASATKWGAMLTAGLTVPLVAAGKKMFDMSVQTNASMGKVNSILQLSGKEWKSYTTELKRGAADTQMAYNDYAEAAYSAISAGVKQADVTDFLTQSNKLAVGGLTDLGKATDVLTTIQNAYGLSQKDMAHVSDVLIQTQNKGKTTVDELASSMGKIIPTAKNLGVSVEQLGAGYAIMTSKGIATAEATTYMNSMFNELGKSGSKTDTILKEISGKSFKELSESGKSTGDILGMLDKYAKDSGLSLSDLFGSAEAGKAAMTLLADGTEGYNEQLEGMINSSGAADKAFNTMSETMEFKLKSAGNALKRMWSDLGDAMAPVVMWVAELITKFAEFTSKMAQAHPVLTSIVIGLLAIVAAIGPLLLMFGASVKLLATVKDGWLALKAGMALVKGFIVSSVIPALSSLWGILLANPIILVIAAIAALVGAFIYLWNNCESFRNFWIGLWNDFKTTCSDAAAGVEKTFNGLKDFFSNLWEAVTSIFSGALGLLKDLFAGDMDAFHQHAKILKNKLTLLFNEMWQNIQDIFTGAVEAVFGIVDQLVSGMPESIQEAWEGVKIFLSGLWEAIVSIFEGAVDIISSLLEGDFQGAADAFSTMWENVIASVGIMWDGFVLYLSGIGTLIWDTIVQMATNVWTTITEWCTNLWTTIKTAWDNIVTDVTTAVTNMYNNVINWFQQLPEQIWFWLCFVVAYVVLWAGQMLDKGVQAATEFVNGVIDWIQQLPGKVQQWLTETINKVTKWASDMWTKAQQAGKEFVQKVIQFIQQLPGKVQQWLTNTISKVSSWASQMASNASRAGQQFIQNVSTFIQQLPGKIASWLSQTVSKAISWASQMGSAGAKAASQLVQKCVSGLAGLPGQMASVGRNIVQGIINGVGGAAGALFSKMKSIATGALNAAKSALGIKSPSRKMRDEVGKWIPQGIAVGMDLEEDGLLNKTKKMANAVADTMSMNLSPSLMASMSGAGISAVDYSYEKGNDNVLDKLSDLVDSINGNDGNITIQLHIAEFNNNRNTDVKTLMNEMTDVVSAKNRAKRGR